MIAAVVLSTLATIGPAAIGAPAAAAGAAVTSTATTITTYRGSTIDPTTGRLYLAGDNKVQVFNPDGTARATIENIYGAASPVVNGTDLWVAETTAGAVARIALGGPTYTVQTFTAGIPVQDSLVVHNGLVWFISSAQSWGGYSLATVNPATGAVVARGGSFYRPLLRTIPGDTTHLLVAERSSSPSALIKLDTTGASVTTTLSTTGPGQNLADVVVTTDGLRIVTASGWPYKFPESSMSTLTATGVEYPASSYPNGVAYSPARGGVVAGTLSYQNQVYIWQDGHPVTVGTFTTAGEVVPASVEVSTDGLRAYVLSGTGPLTLQTFDLGPEIIQMTPAQSVAGVPTTVTVEGRNIGALTSATLGATPIAVTTASPTQVKFDVPTNLAAGAYTLTLTTGFGTATAPFKVIANTGAILSGTVRSGGSPAAGIRLTLSGGGLGAPVTKASAGDGTYVFTGVPYGTTYKLTTHDPSGALADLLLTGLVLVPNDTTMQDLDLQAPPVPAGAALARVPLPSGTTRDVEFEPGTGRVFVSVGDEVVVLNRDGIILARLKNQPGADGIALGGGAVWVNLKAAGRIIKIDPVAMVVVGSWPTTTPTTGGLAYGSGKLWFTDGNDQWVHLAALDPTTGTVQKGNESQVYTPRFTNVLGATDRVFRYDLGISSNPTQLLNTSVFPALSVSSAYTTTGGSDWVVSADRDRAWSTSGQELRLSTMTSTGVTYSPSQGAVAVAYSPAFNGMLAIGQSVFLAGIPVPTHILGDSPATRALALDPSGDRAFYVTGGTFVVWSLRPVLDRVNPGPTATPATVTVSGSGVGGATSVTVDGSDVAFTRLGASTLSVDLPSLTVGTHQVRVVTPWGTSDPLGFKVAAPPGAPSGVSAVNHANSAVVTWTAPAQTGGADIDQFEATASPGGPSCQPYPPASTCTLQGLHYGTTYTVSVRAHNVAGWGPWSAPSASFTPRQVTADFDGDKDTDVAVYRPDSGTWFVKNDPWQFLNWGGAGDIPVPADYDGDGRSEVAVYRPSTGAWYLASSPSEPVYWGAQEGDIPVPGRWDPAHPEKAYPAIYRPSNGYWYIDTPTPRFELWGEPGDIPVPADYDGDGVTDIAVYRPSDGNWWIKSPTPIPQAWGAVAGDIPVPADYDGDGRDDIAIYRPATGMWYIKTASVQFVYFGAADGDIPVPGDYDHDGRADVAIYRPSNGMWYLRTGDTVQFVLWGGIPGDIPVTRPVGSAPAPGQSAAGADQR